MPIQFGLSGRFLAGLDRRSQLPDSFFNALNNKTIQTILLAGRNPGAINAVCDIWGYPQIAAGQQVRALPSAGYSLALVSDSALDVNSTGTGAWLVAVSYLDTAYVSHTAVFAMNGTTAVTVAAQIDGGTGGAVNNVLRQNGMEVISAGTGLANAGNIFACDSTNTYTAGVPQTTTKVFDCMLAGDNYDSSSQYTVPAGFWGMCVEFIPAVNDRSAAGTAKYGNTRVGMTTGANGIFRYFDLGGLSNNNNPVALDPVFLPLAQEKTDVKMQGIVSAGVELGCVNFFLIWPMVG